jgi:hypothetical protein
VVNNIESLDPRQLKKDIIDDEHTIYSRISQILLIITFFVFVLMFVLRVDLFFIPPITATLGIIFAFIETSKTKQYGALYLAFLNGLFLIAWIVLFYWSYLLSRW